MEKKVPKRDVILNAALTLFSEKGFDATTIDEIGDAVNMKGPALYHYFKGKDAILDALIEEAGVRYNANFGSAEHIEQIPDSLEAFVEMSLQKLNFTIHDPQIKKVRRMLAMEQFRNEKIRKLTTIHHLTGIEAMNTIFFEKLIEAGKVKPYDAGLLAFEFTAPVSLMVHLIDREPEKEQEAYARIKQHMNHFVEIYGA